MTHPTVIPAVEILTNRVMGWFGFDQAFHYSLRPFAMIVACDLYAAGVTNATLTREDIEQADERNEGKLRAMWVAMR